MGNQTMKSAKRKTTTLTVALIAPLLLLFPLTPVLAHNAESIEVQKEVDEALGVTELPEPTVVHLQVPQTLVPPLTGQPYDPYQQPAAAQDDFRTGGGGGRPPRPSDRRLKRDVTHIATLENGLKLYSFKYLWDDIVNVGVMAQDLLTHETRRDAVVLMSNGFYAVNYAALGLRMTTLEAWRESGPNAVLLRPAPMSGKAAARHRCWLVVTFIRLACCKAEAVHSPLPVRDAPARAASAALHGLEVATSSARLHAHGRIEA